MKGKNDNVTFSNKSSKLMILNWASQGSKMCPREIQGGHYGFENVLLGTSRVKRLKTAALTEIKKNYGVVCAAVC